MTELQIADAGPSTLLLTDIRIDPELQCRANGVSKATVREYAAAMGNGARFPAVVVFRDKQGTHWLADGFHRIAAAELLELADVAADVREGSRKDALLFAAGANAEHGRARTPADKRKAVMALLSEPAWAKRADNWIAKHANVSHTFVAKLRSTCNDSSGGERETADGRVMDTTKIGKSITETDDAIATKLTSQLERVITQWPDSQHGALRALLTQWAEALTPSAG